MSEADQTYLQENQPNGVPPLELTGERTLPDVPEENYWYRRHVAVYEWIAERCAGLRVVDLACGEGYGSALLAETAREVIGVDANPEAFEHARLKYTTAAVTFDKDLIEEWTGDVDCVVFLQTIEHVLDEDVMMKHVRELIGDTGIAFVSTPNLETLAGPGKAKSENPWHIKEYRYEEFKALCDRHFGSVDIFGLFHARKLAWHALALKLGWDRLHAALRITGVFYEWFTPAISAGDFQLRHDSEANMDRALDFVAVLRP
jgi:SAM-dependent methyltransferase